MRRAAALLSLTLLATLPAAAPAQAPDAELARVQEMIDAGETEQAAKLLNRVVKRNPSGRAYLLRSTMRFVEGDLEGGRADLDRALELDPGQRRAWLNRAALDLSEERFEGALTAFRKAQELEPEAADNAVNIGAVLLLMGRLEEASTEFGAYLEQNPHSADAAYLVAKNYAMAGYAALATEHLRRSIELDERARLTARTDPNFGDLAGDDRFERLMGSDDYRLPPGAHTARRLFDEPYRRGEGRLLPAVLDALQLSGEPFDRRVEVTPAWALIWGDMRIKVTESSDGRGEVQLSAAADRYTPSAWKARTDEFFSQVTVRILALGSMRRDYR